MKDSNGGDIPGTVLESINASERLETQEIAWYKLLWQPVIDRMRELGMYYPNYLANNGYDSGVNPTHSLETQYPKLGDTRIVNGHKEVYVKWGKAI